MLNRTRTGLRQVVDFITQVSTGEVDVVDEAINSLQGIIVGSSVNLIQREVDGFMEKLGDQAVENNAPPVIIRQVASIAYTPRSTPGPGPS